MELFRLLESTDLEEVGVFPQRGDSLSDVSVQLSEHVYNYRRFSKVPDNIFFPTSVLGMVVKLPMLFHSQ
jgi:hypothetical protein